jgi:hypothetical protein
MREGFYSFSPAKEFEEIYGEAFAVSGKPCKFVKS